MAFCSPPFVALPSLGGGCSDDTRWELVMPAAGVATVTVESSSLSSRRTQDSMEFLLDGVSVGTVANDGTPAGTRFEMRGTL